MGTSRKGLAGITECSGMGIGPGAFRSGDCGCGTWSPFGFSGCSTRSRGPNETRRCTFAWRIEVSGVDGSLRLMRRWSKNFSSLGESGGKRLRAEVITALSGRVFNSLDGDAGDGADVGA